jgi:N-acyl homoserine lactone hydrolase
MPDKTDKTKVHVLDCGALHGDLANLLLAPAKVIATRQNPKRPSTWVEAPTHAVVVEHPEGRLLWDTSCPRDWEQRWAPSAMNDFFPYDGASEEQYFDSRLRQLNLEPGDIDIVVISHLHFDHAGNVRMFDDAGARLLVHEDEAKGAFGYEGPFRGAHIKADYEGLNFETVRGDTEILPGVTLLEAPGHTWGTMSLQLDLADEGTMIFTSDAVYLRESYGPPPVGAAIVWDNQAWLRSVEKLRGIAERTNATVVFGHDADQRRELKLAPDAYYS